MADDVATISRSLTKAQRACLLDIHQTDAVRRELSSLGLMKLDFNFGWALSNKGHSVRNHLMEQEHD